MTQMYLQSSNPHLPMSMLCVVRYYTNFEKLYMHTALKCEACLYNRMVISILTDDTCKAHSWLEPEF